jgi:predicted glycoside hydrolase/deacetylase ChbG (UPF0249 family)
VASASPHAAGGTGRRPSIRLIVNADDFGISERVNDGIVLAHRAGIVTATSLMAVGRAFEQAVQWCRRLPSLDVGVHLTLVAEEPLRPKGSSLAGADGRFPAGSSAFLRHFLAGRIRLPDVRTELAAQIERVLDRGIRVSHLDSHQHVHALPVLAALTGDLAGRYGIPFVRVPLEDWRTGRPRDLHGLTRLLGSMVLRVSWTAGRLGRSGVRTPRAPRFLGFQQGGRLDQRRLQRLLCSLRPGEAYELMCHPGFTPEEPYLQRWNYRHTTELQALTSRLIRSEIAARGIRLCSFKELMAG